MKGCWPGLVLPLIAACALLTAAGCSTPPKRAESNGPAAARQAADGEQPECDHFVGWFKLPDRNWKTGEIVPGPGTLIPVLKVNGTYYSVCRGMEVPLKPCPKGLEWAYTPSSMVGTTIGYDQASGEYYLHVLDQAAQYPDNCRICGEPQTMMRIDKPSWLRDPTADRPHTNDDFAGWYELVWFPGLQWQIRQDDQQWVLTGRGVTSWDTADDPLSLTPLADGPGFAWHDSESDYRIVYSDARGRFELVSPPRESDSHVLRAPLARIASPVLPESDPPRPPMRIGIPSWH
jgi:hypothetical protein